jgi:predicted peptidase
LKKLPIIDEKRVYLIGYSMGGFGTWHFLKEEP